MCFVVVGCDRARRIIKALIPARSCISDMRIFNTFRPEGHMLATELLLSHNCKYLMKFICHNKECAKSKL
jgi:hypothetical protein